MALAQAAFRGRGDVAPLNDGAFTHDLNTGWTQSPGEPFRVRFAVSGSGSVGGQLQFSTDGTAYASVTDTSGTVVATRSDNYAEGAVTTAILTDTDDFVGGSADEQDGAVTAVTLSAQHTELEYCVEVISADVSAGDTIRLRVASLDTYTRTPVVTVPLSDRDRVRLAIGDTDSNDYLLTDAQVDTYVAAWPGNIDLAAANAAEAIAASFSRDFNFSTDGQTFNRRERVGHYMTLARELRSRGGALEWPPPS